jgi:hypothetical protein
MKLEEKKEKTHKNNGDVGDNDEETQVDEIS